MGTGTQLGRVRGLGAGGAEATRHFWRQRVTAIGNLVLMTWFIVSLLRLPSLEYGVVAEWLRSPIAAIPMLLLVTSVFYHFRLGLQVVIEDYAHNEGNKVLLILVLNLYTLAAAVTAAFCILKIAFGAAS
jgi:succinate dehydrogenase / fumarate reductase membrane anchor subunit